MSHGLCGLSFHFERPVHPRYFRSFPTRRSSDLPNLSVPDTHLGAAYPNPVEPPSGCTFHPRCAKVLGHCSERAPKPIATEQGHVECHLFDEAKGQAA